MAEQNGPARLVQLKFIQDFRGELVVGEFEQEIPFQVRRFFAVHSVPDEEIRGEHAHRECHQFLLAISGRCKVEINDGLSIQKFNLDSCSLGLYVPPMNWGVQYEYSKDAVLLVFASHKYDEGDYIRDFEEFMTVSNTQQSAS